MIKTGEELHLRNLLSFRKKLTQDEMKFENTLLANFIKTEGLQVVGPRISTTHNRDNATGVIDFELLIPVDKAFNSTDKYKYIEDFKLSNCLKVCHIGNPAEFQKNILNLQMYIKQNNLTPISSIYTVSIKEARTTEEMNNFETESYIRIK